MEIVQLCDAPLMIDLDDRKRKDREVSLKMARAKLAKTKALGPRELSMEDMTKTCIKTENIE